MNILTRKLYQRVGCGNHNTGTGKPRRTEQTKGDKQTGSAKIRQHKEHVKKGKYNETRKKNNSRPRTETKTAGHHYEKVPTREDKSTHTKTPNQNSWGTT